MIKRYTHWLHTQWPAGIPEKHPVFADDGATQLPGTYIVGDLRGMPLLKFSADTGAKAIASICQDEKFSKRKISDDIFDVVILGGGVSGFSAAIDARKRGLSVCLIESDRAFSTIANFPKGKPIYTYPNDFTPAGELQFGEDVTNKENLLESLHESTSDLDISPVTASVEKIERAGDTLRIVLEKGGPMSQVEGHRVIIAIGRSGNYRHLDIPGFDGDKVHNRLHDPADYKGRKVLVIGGGDSALESAIALSKAGADTTLSYRGAEFSRPKSENIDALSELSKDGAVTLELNSDVLEISENTVVLKDHQNKEKEIPNEIVFSMLGRQAPLDFFRRSGIRVSGEGTFWSWLWFAVFLLAIVALYDWKNYGFLNNIWSLTDFPSNAPGVLSGISAWWQEQIADRSSLIGTIAVSMKGRSFYYTVLYTSCIGIFGWLRVRYRKTPYVRNQTIALFLIQLVPLFLLPEIVLPWLGYNGFYDAGVGKSIADSLFPSYISAQELAAHSWPEWGHPRAYWHAYGFILAWPLNVYNVFTPTPIAGWLIISAVQTFIIIPLIIYKWGKGAYCGWICSCGALAETMGDRQRHKMPHGLFWNKLNMLGQVILAAAFIMLVIRIFGWVFPETWVGKSFDLLLKGENSEYTLVNPISWKWSVDVLLGGILGVGLYFKFSGRVWCRFACPLAALMHIYARFSRFRIFAKKEKCISCNACTSVCHQGIDVMSFANKGRPMEDPQCVRCSACVQTCPTGVLSFGEINPSTGEIINLDKVVASPVQQRELIQVKNV